MNGNQSMRGTSPRTPMSMGTMGGAQMQGTSG
eukprot:CAMPEP_0183464246 /NCGR_PEP_ID=MMETSP0370-20130417/145036_1 /TAXON_ID=268820 /ORGANISM="Peridinium aciculiferum, Strain PAER-2" /LENGTH=31 /DNA_ID= /DNA_START= /DNA_END= /DNA_ORIENTATION=